MAHYTSAAIRSSCRAGTGCSAPAFTSTISRLAQEAQRNVERRGRARSSCLDDAGNTLELRITDDRCGLDVKHVELGKDRGIGLTKMCERVERNGGTFQRVSVPGRTSLIASFPMMAATT